MKWRDVPFVGKSVNFAGMCADFIGTALHTNRRSLFHIRPLEIWTRGRGDAGTRGHGDPFSPCVPEGGLSPRLPLAAFPRRNLFAEMQLISMRVRRPAGA